MGLLKLRNGNNRGSTIYVVDRKSGPQITKKIQNQYGDIFNTVELDGLKGNESFVKKNDLQPCTDDLKSNCYYVMDKDVHANNATEIVQRIQDLQSSNPEAEIVYALEAPEAPVFLPIDNVFATGQLWSSILVVFVGILYMAVAIWPTVSVQEPINIPKGEEEL